MVPSLEQRHDQRIEEPLDDDEREDGHHRREVERPEHRQDADATGIRDMVLFASPLVWM